MTWGERGYGYRFDRPGLRRRRFMAERGELPPESADLSAHAPPVMDQGQTGSCTAHAASASLVIGASTGGRPLGFVPSPLELYRLARCLDRRPLGNGELPPLTDDGAEPGMVARAILEWGVVPMRATPSERFSDVNEDNVNREPSLFAIEQAARAVLAGYHAIDSSGDALILDCKRAIARGWPVNVGFYADRLFDGFTAGAPPLETQDRSDPRGGWHYATLIGYQGDRFRLLNSWGIEWGDLGQCWIGPAWLRLCLGIYAAEVKA